MNTQDLSEVLDRRCQSDCAEAQSLAQSMTPGLTLYRRYGGENRSICLSSCEALYRDQYVIFQTWQPGYSPRK